MNFGERMRLLREQEANRTDYRLRGALKKVSDQSVWSFALSEKLIGAVQTLETLGFKTEVRIVDGKAELFAVKYEPA